VTAGERQPLTAAERYESMSVTVNGEPFVHRARLAASEARAVTAERALAEAERDRDGWRRHAQSSDREVLQLREECAHSNTFIGSKGLGDECIAWAIARNEAVDDALAGSSPAAEAEVASGLTEGVAGENSAKASPPCAPSVSPASGVSDTREGESLCSFCRRVTRPWLTDDETWALVEPVLGQGQACLVCFYTALPPRFQGEPLRVSLASPVPAVADDSACVCAMTSIRNCPVHGQGDAVADDPAPSFPLGHLLAAEFALRSVLDEDDAAAAVVALRERGFVIVAPEALAAEALEQEALAGSSPAAEADPNVGGGERGEPSDSRAESQAALNGPGGSPPLSSGRDPACPYCGMTAQVEPSRSEPGRWMCHGCADTFDAPVSSSTRKACTSSHSAQPSSPAAEAETVFECCGQPDRCDMHKEIGCAASGVSDTREGGRPGDDPLSSFILTDVGIWLVQDRHHVRPATPLEVLLRDRLAAASPVSAVADDPAPSCISCDEQRPVECPNSKRACGHHCNHTWSHDRCDWCDWPGSRDTKEPCECGHGPEQHVVGYCHACECSHYVPANKDTDE
jgi:hypothetical protein